MTGSRIRLAVFQFAPRLRDVEHNARRIGAVTTDADVIITPELSLTGYDLRDDAVAIARTVEPGADSPVPEVGSAPDLVIGLAERGAGGRIYNTAAHVRDGRTLARHRKVYLPTYGMFDEGRVFARGDRVRAYEAGGGWRFGMLVCEDLWHPSLAYVLAARDVHAIVVPAAAPGRGVWEGGEAGGRFASWDAWTRIARATAQIYGVYLVLANRVGVEGGLTFAGGSCVIGPTGNVLADAGAAGEAVIEAELSLAEVTRARTPFDHGRDEDPHLTLRELRHAIEAGHG